MTPADVTELFELAHENVEVDSWEELNYLYHDIHYYVPYDEVTHGTKQRVASQVVRVIVRNAAIKQRHPDAVMKCSFTPQKDIGWVLSVHYDGTKIDLTMVIPEPLCNNADEVVELMSEIIGKLATVAKNKENVERLVAEHQALVKRFTDAQVKAIEWFVKKELV